MSKIRSDMSVEELAAIVCETLAKKGIEAILVGGSVVTIYSENEYVSRDLDFITHADRKNIDTALDEIGFKRGKGRHYEHPKIEMIVEFPTPPLAIGDEKIEKWATRVTKVGTLFLLAPTECVMDRLAAFYHWNDKQALDQAIAVAKKQKVNLGRIRSWSKKEGFEDKFVEFFRAI